METKNCKNCESMRNALISETQHKLYLDRICDAKHAKILELTEEVKALRSELVKAKGSAKEVKALRAELAKAKGRAKCEQQISESKRQLELEKKINNRSDALRDAENAVQYHSREVNAAKERAVVIQMQLTRLEREQERS